MTDFALDLPLIHAGKVRRLYALPDGNILMVATDAISAYDHVLATPIPDKGAILNQLSLWWFDQLDDVPNHVLSTDVPDAVQGRAVVVEPLEMVPVECVARGYLTGSGWAEYQASRSVCGVALPEGLVDGSLLPEPIFTPAVEGADGGARRERGLRHSGRHARCRPRGGSSRPDARHLRQGRGDRARAGIILADTKFEFGRRPTAPWCSPTRC